MAELLTLAAVGTVVLTEGIKFLYGQAGEVLKRWRERQGKATEAATPAPQTEAVHVTLPEIFEGQPSPPVMHFDAVQEAEQPLHVLRQDLNDYVEGIEPIDPSNEDLLKRVDALRQLLEAVYQQRLTFKGEQRPASGPLVTGKIDVKQVTGYAAAVRAHEITGGTVAGEGRTDHVESGGVFIGVDVGRIGR
jgi:hypothetical protein